MRAFFFIEQQTTNIFMYITGVYIEDMNSSTGKLYAGLLAIGDEILEINEEKVACLSLDQVTNLLIENQSVTIRVLRHQRTRSEWQPHCLTEEPVANTEPDSPVYGSNRVKAKLQSMSYTFSWWEASCFLLNHFDLLVWIFV